MSIETSHPQVAPCDTNRKIGSMNKGFRQQGIDEGDEIWNTDEQVFKTGQKRMGKQRDIEWAEQRIQAMAWLRESFPAIFSPDIKPLKIGITKDILASHRDGAPDEAFIRRAIGHHVQSSFYLRRMKPGLYRFNMDGQPDGEVTEAEAALAQETLIARQKKCAQKATQIKKERQAIIKTAQAAVMNDAPEEIPAVAEPVVGGKKILTLKKKPAVLQGA